MHSESDVLELLEGIPGNQVNLSLLLEDVQNRFGLIPFVGAGMSVPFGFPQWTTFLRILAEQADASAITEEHIAAGKYEEAAEELLGRLRPRAFQDLLGHHFGDKVLTGKRLTGTIALMPRLGSGPMITTNFDRVMETVFREQGYPLEIALGSKVDPAITALQEDRPFLLKIHGDWAIPNERVLTLAEYKESYGDLDSGTDTSLPLPNLLRLILASRRVLFLGCSLTKDRTVSVLKQIASEFPTSAHYAIVEKPVEQPAFQERRSYLSDQGIRPIFYPTGKHELIEPLLSFLAAKVPKVSRRVPVHREAKAAASEQTPNNIPSPLTRFIGREADLKQVRAALRDNRHVTISGVGGCGKTRLAIEVARSLRGQYPDGVWIVELDSLKEAVLVPQRVASILGIREQATRPPTEVLSDHLQQRKVLLVFDNCEHLVSACAELATYLLQRCPHLKILATSRAVLGVPEETVCALEPLETPDPDSLPGIEEISQNESVRLFVDRARSRQGGFEVTPANARAVALLCRGLEGIPLAIELAAARANVMSVQQMIDRLGDRFQFLAGTSAGALRQWKTLESAVDWSYELLTDPERALLRRLSIFVGGWTWEAASVCALDNEGEYSILNGLEQLHNNSLVVAEERNQQKRFRLLEIIREYAHKKLQAAGEEPQLARRHVNWYLDLSERGAPELLRAGQGEWLDVLTAEADNLRAALRWAIENAEAETALRLCAALWRFLEIRGYFREGRQRMEQALQIPQSVRFPALRSKALSGAGMFAYRQGDLDAAKEMFSESLAIERELGNKPGIANALNDLGNTAQVLGDFAGALALYEDSLALERETQNDRGVAVALFNIGNTARRLGDHVKASPLLEESRQRFETAGNKRESAFPLNALALVSLAQGDLDRASREAERSLAIRRELADKKGVADTLRTVAGIAMARGDHASCRQLLTESLALSRGVEDKRGIAECLENFALLAASRGQSARSALLYGAAEALRKHLKLPLSPTELADRERHLEQARTQLGHDTFSNQWSGGLNLSFSEAAEVAVQQVSESAAQSS